ncbi:hypothetical protein TNCV_3012091 [Trichonephila clavipes]|nr:hypothetical protein TNCV_3012091 [Trichonephila clavipes]
MSSRHHIDDFMRGRIIGKIEEGRKITDVAREFDIAHSVVSRLWKSFKTNGMYSRWHGGGRVRSTTPAEDRYIVLSAKRNRSTLNLWVLFGSCSNCDKKIIAVRILSHCLLYIFHGTFHKIKNILRCYKIIIHRPAVSSFYDPGFFATALILSPVPTFFSPLSLPDPSLYIVSRSTCCQVQVVVPYRPHLRVVKFAPCG